MKKLLRMLDDLLGWIYERSDLQFKWAGRAHNKVARTLSKRCVACAYHYYTEFNQC